jgi:hypothetical protein
LLLDVDERRASRGRKRRRRIGDGMFCLLLEGRISRLASLVFESMGRGFKDRI